LACSPQTIQASQEPAPRSALGTATILINNKGAFELRFTLHIKPMNFVYGIDYRFSG
jgi:hypothetical protein